MHECLLFLSLLFSYGNICECMRWIFDSVERKCRKKTDGKILNTTSVVNITAIINQTRPFLIVCISSKQLGFPLFNKFIIR